MFTDLGDTTFKDYSKQGIKANFSLKALPDNLTRKLHFNGKSINLRLDILYHKVVENFCKQELPPLSEILY